MKTKDWLAVGLVLVGLLQIIGHLTGVRAIKGIGATTAAAPLPIVFTEVRGVETFALDMSIRYTTKKGTQHTLKVDPALYSQMGGAYNWRNVYGAALSYGPVLPKRIWHSILHYGFFVDDTLLKRFGIKEKPEEVEVILISKTKGKKRRWVLKLKRSAPPQYGVAKK